VEYTCVILVCVPHDFPWLSIDSDVHIGNISKVETESAHPRLKCEGLSLQKGGRKDKAEVCMQYLI